MSVNEKMTAIADAIRNKTGITHPLTLDQMAAEIAAIQAGSSNGNSLSPIVDETFTLPADLLATGNSAEIFQSNKISNQNWYCIIIKKLNPVLAADTYEGVALYRLNGFNANMIRWNKTAYSSAHYHTYLNVSDDGIVKLYNQGATLPWLAGEYRITIVG